MKKLVVCSFALMLVASTFGLSYAYDDPTTGYDAGQGQDGSGSQKEKAKMSWGEFLDQMKEEMELSDEELKEFGSAIMLPKIALINSSILSDEVGNVILDNTGNYTFFKKQGASSGDVEDRYGATMYIKGFGGKEKLDLKDYDSSEFENTYYGAVLGLDWDRQYSDNFDATYGLFISYAGSEIKDKDFDDNKITQNAGFAGLRGIWYAGKFFLGAVVDYGFIQNKMETGAGEESSSEDFNTQSIGLSAKAGYNFEVADRSFTIQPNVVFNANYLIPEKITLNKDDDIKTEADDILDMAVAPGLKIAKTLGRCWILSAEGKYVFAFPNGDLKFGNDYGEVTYPEAYYKDYVSCGLGIEKIWGYTVLHVKGHKTFCGRDGYIVNVGIEFKF